jgi:sarcosine oxidase subunit beta
VLGVDSTVGVISAPTVVCAAGVESAAIARQVGLDLPVHGEARTIYFSGKNGGIPDEAPLTIDFSTGFYFHREGPGLLFAGRERRLEDLAEPAVRRLPAIADLPIESSWWGHYDMSPDCNGIIGAAPVPGLYYATGFSGHGFQQSPAVGEHIAELIVGRRPTLNLSAMSADRFSSGRARVEKFII